MAISREALYEQLPADTVRTIVLSPGSQTDPLRCHFRLQKIPPSEKKDVRLSYEALSYTWGAPIFSQYIACRSATWASSSSTAMTILRTLHSGRKLKSTEVTISITQNLYDALVHLRQRWTSRDSSSLRAVSYVIIRAILQEAHSTRPSCPRSPKSTKVMISERSMTCLSMPTSTS